jgi:hypothetical protein
MQSEAERELAAQCRPCLSPAPMSFRGEPVEGLDRAFKGEL